MAASGLFFFDCKCCLCVILRFSLLWFVVLLDEGAAIDALSVIPDVIKKFPKGLFVRDLPAAFEVRNVLYYCLQTSFITDIYGILVFNSC